MARARRFLWFGPRKGSQCAEIILNEVISTLTRLDENSTRVMQQMQVVHDFSEHCALSRPLRKQPPGLS